MHRLLVSSVALLLLAACSPADADDPPAAGEALPVAPAVAAAGAAEAAPDAPPVWRDPAVDRNEVLTADNIYENEEAWPAIVAITKPWDPPGPGATKTLTPPYQGALIRIEPEGRVRIDFGRHGKHDIPFEYTDLVERANRTRTGELVKQAPNFLLQVGTRLVDSSSPAARPVDVRELFEADAFLCIFADPRSDHFAVFAKQLAAFEGENGVRTVFFPQSVVREDTQFVTERLGTLFWHVPFSYPRASPSYTRQLLGEIPQGPYALLVSPHGKVLFRSELTDDQAMARLDEAIRG